MLERDRRVREELIKPFPDVVCSFLLSHGRGNQDAGYRMQDARYKIED